MTPTEAQSQGKGRLKDNQKTEVPGPPEEKDAKKEAASNVRCGRTGEGKCPLDVVSSDFA